MLEFVRDVREVSTFGLDSLDNGESFIDTQVARVRLVSQSVEDEDTQAVQQRPASFRKTVHVRAIGDVVQAKSEDVKASVDQGNRNNPLAQNRERFFGNLAEHQLGN